ncbi:class I SAM-dependent methyltransferase [Phenylobacterium sp.]|uniref:class I SAM-dependent methyltransferase n=1 Tax=Phenylobacterium sp. TaxID=1871053 RepID=UPI0027343848|nr:class I SAM-dependent methyltransferase [Phenylobacterium sp.]MDP3658723.1 class I SAM-dependent methyltransferase [Phenylobacterium sp.]
MPEVRPYYSVRSLSAAYYDLITQADTSLQGDVDTYAELAPPAGEILELGVGTGRVAFALAELGFSVVGVDLAPAMLAQAEAKRANLAPHVGARVMLQLGDMTSLNIGRVFDAVICPFFALSHLPAGAAWRNTFAGIASHLRPGGRAAVHMPLAELMQRPAPAPDAPVMRAPVDDQGRTLNLYVRERSFRPRINRFDQVLDYVLADAFGAVEQRSLERQTYYAADPTPFALEAGLQIDGSPSLLGGVGEIHRYLKPASDA